MKFNSETQTDLSFPEPLPQIESEMSSLCDEFLCGQFSDDEQSRDWCRSVIEQVGLSASNWLGVVRRRRMQLQGISPEQLDISSIEIGVVPPPEELRKELLECDDDELPDINITFPATTDHEPNSFRPAPFIPSGHSVRLEFDTDAFIREVKRAFSYDEELVVACRTIATMAAPNSDWKGLVDKALRSINRPALFDGTPSQ